ncbi:Protein of unknown function [Roseobacter denitrificans OCh 114]|uniref:DUF1523 domain-containing protein n=2 Tax=Roseobacter denitrificans TaxID=2434 RepID=Q16BP4_ROSDO|nr:conserved hypothetical protein [Roseobacter denitrificans OCh 114]SFG19707.1 Protein of unknown function [Roseobacter denitrificans OCh 114]
MMFYVKWVFILVFWGLIGSVLHYTLPQVDIVRITDTYEKRETPGANSIFWSRGGAGTGEDAGGRDVFFIQSRKVNDRVMIYRNEDTGWGWPPYFKFDTSNLQAEAADLRSTAADPQYAAIRHYGWRIEFFSVFPNAVSIWPVDGPDASKPLPWVNGIILAVLGFFGIAIWRRWRRFKEARIDPKLEELQDSWEATEDAVAEKRSRLRRWWAMRTYR